MRPVVGVVTFLWFGVAVACRYDTAGSDGSDVGDVGDVGDPGDLPDIDAGDDIDASEPPDPIDAAPPGPADAMPQGTPDAAPVRVAGTKCPQGDECPMGWACLDEDDGWPASGECTRACTSDADCGPGAFCSQPLGQEMTRLCFADCSDCPAGDHVCSDTLTGLALGDDACLPGNAAADNGDGCSFFYDCREGQVCVDEPFDAPGGYCTTVGCTVGNNATCDPGDAVCIVDQGITFCVDTCEDDEDCREADGYGCQSIGGGTALCVAEHRDAGDACQNDAECGPAPWDCLTGGGFPGGYCSAKCEPGPGAVCPDGSVCHDPPGGGMNDAFCAEECSGGGMGNCRMGYQCEPSSVMGVDVCQ